MLDETTKQAVVDYVLGQPGKEYLKLVVALHEAWETIRFRVINEFTNQLVRVIVDALPAQDGWSIETAALLNTHPGEGSHLGIRRSTWNKALHVGIEAQASGPSKWIIGAWGEKGYEQEGLKALLIERWGVGKTTEVWPWFHDFSEGSEFGHRELEDWKTGAAIIELAEGLDGEYGKRLSERIVSIARTVDGLFR